LEYIGDISGFHLDADRGEFYGDVTSTFVERGGRPGGSDRTCAIDSCARPIPRSRIADRFEAIGNPGPKHSQERPRLMASIDRPRPPVKHRPLVFIPPALGERLLALRAGLCRTEALAVALGELLAVVPASREVERAQVIARVVEEGAGRQ